MGKSDDDNEDDNNNTNNNNNVTYIAHTSRVFNIDFDQNLPAESQ